MDTDNSMDSLSKYNFLEWYKLNLGTRADLITMIEGVRPGACVQFWNLETRFSREYRKSQEQLLQFCCQKLGISFRVNDNDYYAAMSQLPLDDLWGGKIKTGEFLGYPKCCIEAFENGCRVFMAGDNRGAPAVRYGHEQIKALRGRQLPDDTLYLQHIPCNLYCLESFNLARRSRVVLVASDIEAAEYLRSHNLSRVYEFCYLYPEENRLVRFMRRLLRRWRTR